VPGLLRELEGDRLVVAVDPGKVAHRVWLAERERGLLGEPVTVANSRDRDRGGHNHRGNRDVELGHRAPRRRLSRRRSAGRKSRRARCSRSSTEPRDHVHDGRRRWLMRRTSSEPWPTGPGARRPTRRRPGRSGAAGRSGRPSGSSTRSPASTGGGGEVTVGGDGVARAVRVFWLAGRSGEPRPRRRRYTVFESPPNSRPDATSECLTAVGRCATLR
jgi:hypothetical protein